MSPTLLDSVERAASLITWPCLPFIRRSFSHHMTGFDSVTTGRKDGKRKPVLNGSECAGDEASCDSGGVAHIARGMERHDFEGHARVGRVPDSSMMLNIAVRAMVDRMPGLGSFRYEDALCPWRTR